MLGGCGVKDRLSNVLFRRAGALATSLCCFFGAVLGIGPVYHGNKDILQIEAKRFHTDDRPALGAEGEEQRFTDIHTTLTFHVVYVSVAVACGKHLGIDNVYVLGCRAIGEEELDRDDVIPFISSYDIMDKGIEWAIETALESVKNERVYLTVDIDGIDPAYAPGTGTPEPFGLHPMDVKKVINRIGDRLAGFDVVEVCPPADPAGITSILAARYINEVIAVHGKNLRS